MQKEKKEKKYKKRKSVSHEAGLLLTGARGFLLVVLDTGRRISLHSSAASPRCLSVSLSDTNFTIRRHSAREAAGVWGKGGFSCLSLVWSVRERLAILHVGAQTCLWSPFSGRGAFGGI